MVHGVTQAKSIVRDVFDEPPANTAVPANKPITREVFDVRSATCQKR